YVRIKIHAKWTASSRSTTARPTAPLPQGRTDPLAWTSLAATITLVMFVAVDLTTNERLVSLDFKSASQIETLRALGRADRLGCPECRQPVNVRHPQERRRHFFHKDRGTCPLHEESAELVEARAVLYEWLSSKVGGRVRIEFRPDNARELP